MDNKTKVKTLRSSIEHIKKNIDKCSYFNLRDDLTFTLDDISYFNDTITEDFIKKLNGKFNKKFIINLFIYFAKIGLEKRNELLKLINIDECLEYVELEIIKSFCSYYHLTDKIWRYLDTSQYNYDMILEEYKKVLIEDKGEFVMKVVINNLKKQIPYSKRISNKSILNLIKENKDYLKMKIGNNYPKLYQSGLIEIKDIPIEEFKCEDIFRIMNTNRFPEISKLIKGKKYNDDFYINFFKEEFPEDELILLSKILIIQRETLKILPKNKEAFKNFLRNIIYHSYYTKHSFNVHNNSFYIDSLDKSYLDELGFTNQSLPFEESLSIFKELFQEKVFSFNYRNFYTIRDDEIPNYSFEDFFLIAQNTIEGNDCNNLKILVFKLINSIVNTEETSFNINCYFELNEETHKKIYDCFTKYHVNTYLFLMKNQRSIKFNITLKQIKNRTVHQTVRFFFFNQPNCLFEFPIKAYQESILPKIKTFFDEIDGITDEELKEFLTKPIFEENKILFKLLIETLLKNKTDLESKILNIIKDFSWSDTFPDFVKNKIKLLNIDSDSKKNIDKMKIGCKRKFEEISKETQKILQEESLSDNTKLIIQKLLDNTKEKIILEEIIENPVIKCPISLEYYEPQYFFTLNCGHKVLKNCLKEINFSCPLCRKKIKNISTTLVQNDFQDLKKELSSF